LLIVLLLAPAAARAAETASFLQIGVGARALAMGGAATALSDDANSIYWNAAGLAALEKREFTASHAALAETTRHDFAALAAPTPAGTFAAGFTYLSQDALNGRDAAGAPTGDFNASDAAASLALGRKMDPVDVGAAVKYVRSHIGSAEAQTFAVDAGARKAWDNVSIGLAVRNLGPGLKYGSEVNDLPLRVALGAAYRPAGGHALAAEWTQSPRGAGAEFGVGGEFQALQGVFLRGGYTTQTALPGGSGFDAARGLTLGVGLRQSSWSVDYAAVPMGELGGTHRFTFAWRF
jgi:hypothetical protein